jgi:Bacterial protein of unknown function (DUF922)
MAAGRSMHLLSGFTLAVLLAAVVPLPQEPQGAEEIIVWSATRKLDWKDFRSKPPPNTLAGALSAISHDYAVGCRDQALQLRVQTIFVPGRSWVTYRIVSSGLASRVGIRHEQIHFDLAEVYTRRIRKMFRELRDPCPRSDAELAGMVEQIIKEHWTAQRRYDTETENGQLEAKQNDWEKRIAAELTALAPFAERPEFEVRTSNFEVPSSAALAA